MVKLADIIDPIYREYLPLLQRKQYRLDLDLTNPSIDVANPPALEFAIKKYLDFVTSNPNHQGSITISSNTNRLIIKDSATILTTEQIQAFSVDGITAKSRVGFGTTLSIELFARTNNRAKRDQ